MRIAFGTKRSIILGMVALAVAARIGMAHGQQQSAADHAAAIKASMAASQAALHQYEWVETTVVSLNGEEKSRSQNRVYYGAEGKQEKVALTPPPPEQQQRGIRGRVAASKKQELTETMQKAVALVHQYMPPDPVRIDAVKAAEGMSMQPGANGQVTLTFANYLKPGDSLAFHVNMATNEILGVQVTSYLDSPDDALTMNVTMATLPDATIYTASMVLNLPKENLSVAIDNSGYRKTAS